MSDDDFLLDLIFGKSQNEPEPEVLEKFSAELQDLMLRHGVVVASCLCGNIRVIKATPHEVVICPHGHLMYKEMEDLN